MRISIVTSIANEKDDLREDFCFEGAKFIAYTDQKSPNWISRPVYSRFTDVVRNAKIHKALIHKFADECDVSIWVDGNISFNVPAEQIIDQLLGDGDMWCMTHPWRKDIYDEALICHVLDNNPESVFRQAEVYRQEGFPGEPETMLYECNVIIRRHSEKMRRFNEKWWSEICCHSRRDQLSFPYALYHSPDIDMRTMVGNVREHPYFKYAGHNW